MNVTTQFSTIALLKVEFEKLGYVVETIIQDNLHYSRFTAPSGESWLTSNSRIRYPFTSHRSQIISREKNQAYDLARQLGVAIPLTILIERGDDKDDELTEMLLQAPLIVKPNDASLAHGLTMNIHTSDELYQAIETARQISDSVLCQKQISGDEIRIVVIGGVATAAIWRQTPRVCGDGISTVRQLIDEENEARQTMELTRNTYPLLKDGIIKLSMIDLEQILPTDKVMELRKTAMIRYGASIHNISDSIDPSYMKTAEKLANSLGHGLIAVDMFVDDYRTPQSDTNYAFVEFNTSPILDLFYSCRDKNDYDVLNDLVPLIDETINHRRSDLG